MKRWHILNNMRDFINQIVNKNKSVIILSLVFTLLLSGCRSMIRHDKKETVFATGGTSGTYFSVGDNMATILNPRFSDKTLTVLSTGGSGENLQLLSEHKVGLAVVQNDVMYYAYSGTDIYSDAGENKEFSAVAGLYNECVQIVTCKDNISSVMDLRGKIVSVGDIGSGVEFNARQLLDSYGLTFSDIRVVNASFADSAEGLLNGTIDAAFIVSGAPTKAVSDLSEKKNIHLVSIDDDQIRILHDKYGFYTKATVPSGTYSGLTSDVDTVAIRATLVASNKMSEDDVYELLTLLFNEKDRLSAGESRFSELDLNNVKNGISIPFHKGAVKYYREQGLEGF